MLCSNPNMSQTVALVHVLIAFLQQIVSYSL